MLLQNAGTFINQRGFVNRLFRYPQVRGKPVRFRDYSKNWWWWKPAYIMVCSSY